MLTDGQVRELRILIQRFIGVGPSYDAVVTLIGHDAFDRLPGQRNTAEVASWIVDLALGQDTPALFLRLVMMADTGGASPDLHALADALSHGAREWTGTGSDQDLWVPSAWPFLDRTDLRAVVGRCARGQGPAVMTIEAPAGHGKGTMSKYIELVAHRTGVVKPVPYLLDADAGSLDGVVADLRRALGLPPAGETTHAEPDSEARVEAQLLSRQAKFAPERAWFVAYLAEPTDLEPGVLKFLDELIGAVLADPLTARNLQITVLTDDTRASGLTRLPESEARFVLPEVDLQHVNEWLAAVAPGKPEGLYAEVARTVFQQLEQRGAPAGHRLRWLARYCDDAHKLLRQGA